MRPKVVLGIFLIAAWVLAIGLIVSRTTRPQPPIAAARVTAFTPASAPEPAPPAPVFVSAPAPSAPAAAPGRGSNDPVQAQEQHDQYVKDRYDDLMAKAMLDDTASHEEIVRELTNPDTAIRRAALAAVQQTQDRALIPEIQQIADATDDPDYKQALQGAISFLKLPTFTEVLRQQQQTAQQNGAVNPSAQSAQPASLSQDQNPGQVQQQ